MTQLYDSIGRSYRNYRQPDPRIAAAIARALGSAKSVVNVGAGAGSYEPRDRPVIAVEPSIEMVRQRAADAAPVIRAFAGELPFRDRSFDAALATLTVHHWPDRARGLREMRRVARRVVLYTWDPAVVTTGGFWLTDDYFPEIVELDRGLFPSVDEYRAALGAVEVVRVPIPHDCTDGFLGAYWRRPHEYLDAGARGAISTFWKVADVERGLARLRRDLEDGTWMRHHGHVMAWTELDLGYRLVIAAST